MPRRWQGTERRRSRWLTSWKSWWMRCADVISRRRNAAPVSWGRGATSRGRAVDDSGPSGSTSRTDGPWTPRGRSTSWVASPAACPVASPSLLSGWARRSAAPNWHPSSVAVWIASWQCTLARRRVSRSAVWGDCRPGCPGWYVDDGRTTWRRSRRTVVVYTQVSFQPVFLDDTWVRRCLRTEEKNIVIQQRTQECPESRPESRRLSVIDVIIVAKYSVA